MAWWYCDRCDRNFTTPAARNQHDSNSSMHWICDSCNLDFASWLGRKEHYVQSPAHHYCQYCDQHFSYSYDLENHFQSQHDYCSQCRRVFKNDIGLHEHYRQSSTQHHYCVSCRRLFGSANNLNAHLNSSTHQPRNIPCPGRGCSQSFINGSSLAAHLESGSCSSGANRQAVNRYIRENDTRNIITDPARLLTAGANDGTRYFATDQAWNGGGYECYLCHHEFRTLPGLNQHLASPRHEEKVYICRGPTCSRRFHTLSALWAHVESEQCGVTRFGAVKRAMDEMVGNMRRARITF
ncbi:Zinc finger protein [Mycena kentingensis (nom. inval.)]|nr:Zinc finger protein [Mycena kentingensis (nom. inval.)]